MSQWVENTTLGDWLVAYVRRLRLYKGKGAGEPIDLRPWQERKFIRDLFSTVDKDTGLRRYTEAFFALPKKNGKSTLIAALVVLLLCGDGEAGAEVYSAASTRAQASIVFRTVANMIRKDPWLRKRCKVNDTLKRIVYLPTQGFYQALSADSDYSDGIDASAVIYDELHRAPNSALYDLLKQSMGARRQPLLITITTAGSDKATVCGEVWDYAVKVRDGIVENPRFYPCIYAADPKDDWTDPAVWMKANPALGDFLSMTDMEEACARAKAQPSFRSAFLRYRLNIWAQSDEAWLPLTAWDECKVETPPDLTGRKCYLGIDLSSTGDLTAVASWFPDDDGEGGYVSVDFFCPEENLMGRQEATGVPYVGWRDAGLLTATPGNVVDYSAVRAKVNQRATEYGAAKVLIDPYNSTGMETDLLSDGLEVVKYPQTMPFMHPPSKQFERMVLSRKIRHNGHPIMRWMVSNCKVYADPNGNVKPCKRRSKLKIDGVTATITAIGGSLTPGEGPGAFESEGSYVL